MNRDFFDEEFDRQMSGQQQQNDNSQNYGGWYSAPPAPPVKKNNNKPLYILLVSVLLVVAFALGWGLCVLTNSNEKPVDTTAIVEETVANFKKIVEDNYNIVISDEHIAEAIDSVAGNTDHLTADSKNQQILLQVFSYLRNNYYITDISDYQWEMAVAAAGTAMFNTAGDQFSHLMTPTDYLWQMYPEAAPATQTLTIYGNLTFGIVLNYTQNVGINVSSVADDSSAFGRFQEGDQIVKITNMKGGRKPKVYADALGNPVWIFDQNASGIILTDIDLDYINSVYSQLYSNYLDLGYTQDMFQSNSIVLKNFTYNQASYVLQTIYSATFHVLRDGQIVTIDLVRGVTGNTDAINKYGYEYVEFYFGDFLTNISTVPLNNSNISVKQSRCLDQLPADTGYIRLIQFEHDADKEMKEVLQMFKDSGLKHLVLDLKGNPGGYVSVATNIGAMLVDTMFLTSDQIDSLKTSALSNNMLMTKLVYRDGTFDRYTGVPSYSNYFDAPTGTTKNIVVWTDGNSASASEMLTGVILDYQTGIHMGTRTYGKGIAQTIEPLDIKGVVRDEYGEETTYTVGTGAGKKTISEFNWAVYYTCAKYYSPLGTNIQGTGYTPAEPYNNLSTYADLVAAVAEYYR
ncbi:MAG: hypothetical protein IKD26_02400 [Clostridia bacterium]|nr:hypothetical protein [Clostridia bacterium]